MAESWSDGETHHGAALHGDVAGYSRLIADNEIETHQTLQTYRRRIEQETGARNGTLEQFVGDEFLAIFPDARSALEAALDIQRHIAEGNAGLPVGRRMRFRLGVNSGPISLEDGQWYGDTINIAARLQAMGEPGGITISGPALDAVGDIDIKIESLGQQRLKNIPEPVLAYLVKDESATEAETKPWRRRVAKPTLPSLAVSPFVNLGEPGDEHLADGLMMGLAISLMTIPGLELISENSTLHYRSEAFSAQQLGHELGVQYVLEGGVQRSGTRIRVMTHVVDVDTGQTVWADRFEATLDDVFEAQDQIVHDIVEALDVEVISAGTARMYRANLDAESVELLYKGLHYLSLGTPGDLKRAEEEFDNLIERSPEAATGYSSASIAHFLSAINAPPDGAAEHIATAEGMARRALELDDPSGIAHAILSYVMLLRHDWEGAAASAEKATAARPSCDLSFGVAASVLRYLGRWEDAVEHADRAIRLSPLFSDWYQSVLADAYLVGEEYEMAADTAEGVVAGNEDNTDALLTLAASQAALGRERHAAAALKQARATRPKLTAQGLRENLPFQDDSATERFVDLLEDAGLT
ncbi:MAG: adenylate/guanylate cyclase domain-containing protein [Acidimicrobiia bacterium]|nr:MAG: adenylate/guanylate cyclase domain-containing protein [Acidimicrobiia bacterium]